MLRNVRFHSNHHYFQNEFCGTDVKLKGDSVLQVVPRGQAQQAAAGPPIQYSQLQYRPSPTDPQQFPLNIGASVTPSEQGSLHGGSEVNKKKTHFYN